MTDLEDLRSRMAVCPNCPWEKCKTRTVLFEGTLDAEVMIVGRNPGEQEDRFDRPFYPKAPGGSQLHQFMDWVNYS